MKEEYKNPITDSRLGNYVGVRYIERSDRLHLPGVASKIIRLWNCAFTRRKNGCDDSMRYVAFTNRLSEEERWKTASEIMPENMRMQKGQNIQHHLDKKSIDQSSPRYLFGDAS